MHNKIIKSLNLNACYTRTRLDNAEKIIETFQRLKLTGANVTIPHKEHAFKLCHKVEGIAKKIGAVNTLVNIENQIIGYNTDAPGFLESIKSFSNIKSALVLGAGGTAKAIAFILRENHVQTTILNRSKQRLEFFQDNDFKTFTWKNFDLSSFDLIINTTPAGLNNDDLPLHVELLNPLMSQSKYAFDVVYGKITPFIKLACKNSLKYKDGSDMLLFQAVLAFNLFYQNRYKIDIIKKEMTKIFDL